DTVLQQVRRSFFFFFQAEDGIRDFHVTGVQTCALPILRPRTPGTRTAPAAGPNAPSASVGTTSPGRSRRRPGRSRTRSTATRFEIGRASCRERERSAGEVGAARGRGQGGRTEAGGADRG